MDVKRITPDLVADLLDENEITRVPQDRLKLIASMLESLRGNEEWKRNREVPPNSCEEKVIAEAQAILDKLRKLSPSVLLALRNPPKKEFAGAFDEEADVFENWIEAMPTLRLSEKEKADWHIAANVLLEIYRANIDPKSGSSKHGPAVRFISGALRLCGYGHKEPVTIEQAIRRYLQESSNNL